jgi:ferric-dicitrate binding protein FerR (iron transport regulator)
MNTKIPYDLLAKYIAGQATLTESDKARKWIGKSHQNSELFYQLKKIWEELPDDIKDFSPDVDEALKNVNTRIINYQGFNNEAKKSIKITLILLRIAAVFLIIAGGWLVFNQLSKPRYVTKINESNNPFDLILHDKTVVTLNKGAYLKYPKKFNKNVREVEFYGEAFFQVSKAIHKPFIIHTDNSYIRVLGTSFNIRALKSEETIAVSVTEGKVEFGSVIQKEPLKIEIDAGKTGILEKDKKLRCIEDNDTNFLAWKTGKLVFSKKPLGEALQQIEKYFSISVRPEDLKLDTLRIDVTLYKGERQEIIKTLEILLGYKIKEKEGIFIITSESI